MNRNKMLQVRFTEDEYNRLCRDAESEHLSVSDFVRIAVEYKHYSEVPKPVRSSFCDKIARWFGR